MFCGDCRYYQAPNSDNIGAQGYCILQEVHVYMRCYCKDYEQKHPVVEKKDKDKQ